MYKKIQNKRGLTVLELIIAIAIGTILIGVSINLLRMTSLTHSQSLKEYDLQSSIRMATEQTNQIVRYSKAVFAVPQTFVESVDVMDPGWSYLMVSDDGKKIISMEYNDVTDKFEEKVLVSEQKNIRYEIFFEKDDNAKAPNVMKYVINSYIVDEDGNRTGEKIVHETTVESINAVQVADKGTGINKGAAPSIALAYRSDGQTAGKGRRDLAYITFIVDVSGSMRLLPTDIDANVTVPGKEKSGSRMQKVREALNGTTGRNAKEGIVKRLEKEENVYVSLVPFSTTANYPEVTENKNSNRNAKHPIYYPYKNEVKSNNSRHKTTLSLEITDKLKADGGTNTGDGLRRAYHLHKNFRTTMEVPENTKTHHYMVMLVDGQSTFETTNRVRWQDNGEYVVRKNNSKHYDWVVNWVIDANNTTYKMDDGNITTTTYYPTTTATSSGSYNTKKVGNTTYRYYGKKRNDATRNSLTVTGPGNLFVGTGYVDKMGESIRKFDNNNGIKSYVIGYATGLTHRVEEIGASIGTEPDKIYSYDDEDFDLDEVFESITNDILADFWVVTGPQIQK